MKVTRILDILDIAWEARMQGRVWNPLFISEAGLGKSALCRQWVQQMREKYGTFGFLDLRLAYYEGPDFVGMPKDELVDEIWRTISCLPEFWPADPNSKGLILLEEPNRGNDMIMNCLMQMLTDREIGHKYKIPEQWIIAGAINPEGAQYSVNAMDAALKDRFEPFHIDYDYQTFMNYIEKKEWHKNVTSFVSTGEWVYKSPDKIKKGGRYISPRTWEKMNTAELSGASEGKGSRQIHRIICTETLGKDIGDMYYKNSWDDAPILARDLLADLPKALKKIRAQSKAGDSYAGDKISVTIDDIVKHYGGWYEGRMVDGKEVQREENKIDEPTMAKVAKEIPKDLSLVLIKECGMKAHKGQLRSYFKDFTKRNPDCVSMVRDSIKVDRAVRK